MLLGNNKIELCMLMHKMILGQIILIIKAKTGI